MAAPAVESKEDRLYMMSALNAIRTRMIPAITRRLGKPSGLERITRLLVPPSSFTESDSRMIRADGCLLSVYPHSHVGWQLYCMGTYERGLRGLMRAFIRPGDLCLDVGANIGWHTLLLSRLVGSSGHVHAFEPNPSVLKLLNENLHLNDIGNTTVHPVAVGNVNGEAFFNAPPVGSKEAGNGYMVNSSLDEGNGVIRVPICVLDSLLLSGRPVRFIKIDVEGYEAGVLQGASHILARYRPIVCMEQLDTHVKRAGFAAEAPTSVLRGLGYTFLSYGDRGQPAPIVNVVDYVGEILAVPQEGCVSR